MFVCCLLDLRESSFGFSGSYSEEMMIYSLPWELMSVVFTGQPAVLGTFLKNIMKLLRLVNHYLRKAIFEAVEAQERVGQGGHGLSRDLSDNQIFG